MVGVAEHASRARGRAQDETSRRSGPAFGPSVVRRQAPSLDDELEINATARARDDRKLGAYRAVHAPDSMIAVLAMAAALP